MTRPAVPQVMRCSPPDLRNVLDLVPDTPQKIRIVDRRSIFIRKHPLLGIENFSVSQRLFLPLGPQPFQFRGKLRAHIDLPLRRFRLRRLHLAVMRNVPPYDDVVFLKVDIDPLKGRRLSNPHARPGHAENKRIMFWKPLPASRLDQMQFFDREGIDLLLDLLGRPVEHAFQLFGCRFCRRQRLHGGIPVGGNSREPGIDT